MLELPEIVTIRDQLNATVLGKTVVEVIVIQKRKVEGTTREGLVSQTQKELQSRLYGAVIVEVKNRYNRLFILLNNGFTLALGAIYGTILYHRAASNTSTRNCLRLAFDDGSSLSVTVSFFGSIRVLASSELPLEMAQEYESAALDPSSSAYNWAQFLSLISGNPEVHKLSAKKFPTSCLPTYIGGIGNGYLQEILYRARIHPKRKMAQLSTAELKSYCTCIAEVVNDAVALGGRYNEQTLFGKPGKFVPAVRKETAGLSCQKCGSTIERFQFLGGACYICPGCQPLNPISKVGLLLLANRT